MLRKTCDVLLIRDSTSASTVLSLLKMLPRYLNLDTSSTFFPSSIDSIVRIRVVAIVVVCIGVIVTDVVVNDITKIVVVADVVVVDNIVVVHRKVLFS